VANDIAMLSSQVLNGHIERVQFIVDKRIIIFSAKSREGLASNGSLKVM
jgi:hypothetical protein